MSKKTKKVKAWAIINKKDEKFIFALPYGRTLIFFDRGSALSYVGPDGLVVPCTITYEVSK